ncbi:serine/threonine-protein kinase [Kineosporia succinea]|uniref:RelA/SpoT domain-containing protein n=1 Tax=Kineosporia succinea TaxID=84632 RepID=A0ABT9NZR0_9ACTN|nr:hypothetical protein [Kineosporia succinea]MDP9825912.1 hypothetical protein [Kineosporia succinea]
MRAVQQATVGGIAPGELTRLSAQVGAAESLSRHLLVIAAGLEAASLRLPTPVAQAVAAPAASAVSALLGAQPGGFHRVASACRRAATAYSQHAECLRSAIHGLQRSVSVPPDLAEVLRRDAARQAADSARLTASTLSGLAAVAPARPPRWRRWLGTLNDLRGEVVLGGGEAAQATLVTAARFSRYPTRPDLQTTRAILGGLRFAATQPGETFQGVVDWETWRTNPARAAGHLIPSAAGGFGGANLAATLRPGQLARAQRAAVLARAHEAGRRAATEAAARAARSELISRSTTPASSRLRPWLREDGQGLTPQASAAIERYAALTAAREPGLTAVMREVSRAARGDLAGLAHRLKDGESLKRKVASERGSSLPALLDRAGDAVRYTVVLDARSYVSGVQQVSRLLERRGYQNFSVANKWHSPRYRGLNTTWAEPSTGVVFEVQFHTPASWQVTRETHGMYEELRRTGTPQTRKDELTARIGERYRTAPVPEGAEYLQKSLLPPSGVIERVPVDQTVPAAVAGALAPAGAGAGQRGTDPDGSPR